MAPSQPPLPMFMFDDRFLDDHAGQIVEESMNDDVVKMTLADSTEIRPMSFGVILAKAHARTFNLQVRLANSVPAPRNDPDVEAVLSSPDQRELFRPRGE